MNLLKTFYSKEKDLEFNLLSENDSILKYASGIYLIN